MFLMDRKRTSSRFDIFIELKWTEWRKFEILLKFRIYIYFEKIKHAPFTFILWMISFFSSMTYLAQSFVTQLFDFELKVYLADGGQQSKSLNILQSGLTIYTANIYILITTAFKKSSRLTLWKNPKKQKLQNTLPDFWYMVQKC